MPLYAAPEVPHWDFPRTPASVALLVSYGREHGASIGELLDGSRLSEPGLSDVDATITARQELAVAANLVRTVPGSGFDVGARYHVGTFGIFGYACLTSPTLGDAVRFAIAYYELSFGFCLPTVTIDGEVATLRLDLPDVTGPVAAFLVERDLAAMTTVMTDLLGAPMPFDTVSFAFSARDGGADGAAENVLGVVPDYGAPATSATFRAELLTRPLPQASAMTVALCASQCRDLVTRRRARSGVAQQVRGQLVTIDGAPHTIGSVARSLAMSERTLRRRLTEEDTSFRQLSDEVNHALAEEMLATGALSVADVAIRLGYAEASTFIAAFKRWAGTTPARYQRSTRSRHR